MLRATSMRAALRSLGERDAPLLMQRVQVRGVLADAGISDRGLVVLFGELAGEGILFAWWCFEESACEDAMRTIRALGMESVASPILMRNVLAHRVSPEHPKRSRAPDFDGGTRWNEPEPRSRQSDAKSATPTSNPPLAPEPGLRNTAAALLSGSPSPGPQPPFQRARSRSFVTQLPSLGNRLLRRVLTGSIILLLVGLAAWALTYVGGWPALRGVAENALTSRTEVACPTGYVSILPGSFSKGSSLRDEIRYPNETQHTITITRAFCIQSTEVTQGEFLAVMGNNPSRFTSCGMNCPVERVSWEDSVAFANERSRSEGLPQCYNGATSLGPGCAGYRLPTAAEWEYAARAGSSNADTRDLRDVAWFAQNSRNSTHPVAQKLPNAWGLYDTLGNVYEWTGDWFDDFNGSGADPVGPAEGWTRENRGGSWLNTAEAVRPTYRGFDTPTFRSDLVGFRLVRSPP